MSLALELALTRRGLRIGVALPDQRRPLAVDPDMRQANDWAEAGNLAHASWSIACRAADRASSFFRERLPNLACRLGGRDRARGEAEVAVGIARPEAAARPGVTDALQDLLAAKTQILDVVAGIGRQAAACESRSRIVTCAVG